MRLEDCDLEMRIAVDAVRAASELARSIQNGTIGRLEKEDRSPVTVADYAVQALVGRRLQESFPEDPLVAEEDSGLLLSQDGLAILDQVVAYLGHRLSEVTPEAVCCWIQHGRGTVGDRFWILDPIDGTKGFLRGGQYVVALALVQDGDVRLGVLGCPALEPTGRPSVDRQGSLFLAARDGGCWAGRLNSDTTFQRVRVSSVREPNSARVLRSVESGHTNPDAFGDLLNLLETKVPPILMDSQAKCATLAAGHADLLFRLLSRDRLDYREKIWDQAAGSLVIEEAGGKVTDLLGHPLDFRVGPKLLNNRGIVASNGHLHESALRVAELLQLADA